MFQLPIGAIDNIFTAPKPAVGPMEHLTYRVAGVTDPVPSAEVKNGWSYTSAVSYPFMAYTGTTLTF